MAVCVFGHPWRHLLVGLWALACGHGLPAFAGGEGGAPGADTVTTKDGRTISGEILDITDRKVVVASGKGKTALKRGDVAAIARAASPEVLSIVQRRFESFAAAGTLDDWKGLSLFCQRQKLLPERRRALREVVRLDPTNAEARAELGHARLGEKWLDEDEVEAKRKEGYEVVAGKLEKRGPGTSVRKNDGVAGKYKLLEREKLSEMKRKEFEKEREKRLRAADKYLAQKEKEYNGIDWTKRHVIKTRNFEIHCNSTRKVAEQYGALMELIRAKVVSVFPGSRLLRNLRASVFIYASQEEFMSNDPLGRWGGRGIGGYYRPDTQAITAFHGTFGMTGTTFGVLCHEGTHYYQGLVLKAFDNAPMWLIEGLAVYFGDGSVFDPDSATITTGQVPRDRLAHIQEKMTLKRNTALKELIALKRGKFNGSHYADSWALIYFLLNTGDKGKKFIHAYWMTGIDRLLTNKDFSELADRYFGGIQGLEKEYVDFTLKLDMPAAGKVVGDYFVSDTFQFDYRSPGDDWQFFEDRADKRLLVGLVYPGTSAEIRIYYRNNELLLTADKFFEEYLRVAGRHKDLKHERLKSGKLEWYKVTYVDEGRPVPREAGEGAAKKTDDADPGKGEGGASPGGQEEAGRKQGAPSPGEPKRVVTLLLIQMDAIVEIKCLAKMSEAANFDDSFQRANESFTQSFTRRW